MVQRPTSGYPQKNRARVAAGLAPELSEPLAFPWIAQPTTADPGDARGSNMLREADRHLERVIYRAIQDAKLAGRDNTIQNEVAVRTVRWIRPEMTASEALTVVKAVRHKRLQDA